MKEPTLYSPFTKYLLLNFGRSIDLWAVIGSQHNCLKGKHCHDQVNNIQTESDHGDAEHRYDIFITCMDDKL